MVNYDKNRHYVNKIFGNNFAVYTNLNEIHSLLLKAKIVKLNNSSLLQVNCDVKTVTAQGFKSFLTA